MIRITVELVPYSAPHKPRHLGTAVIYNDGTGTATVGNYRVGLSKRGRPRSVWKEGRVRGFPRKRLGAWDLLFRALLTTVGKRNGIDSTREPGA